MTGGARVFICVGFGPRVFCFLKILLDFLFVKARNT
jgi:hypothetical protein